MFYNFDNIKYSCNSIIFLGIVDIKKKKLFLLQLSGTECNLDLWLRSTLYIGTCVSEILNFDL